MITGNIKKFILFCTMLELDPCNIKIIIQQIY